MIGRFRWTALLTAVVVFAVEANLCADSPVQELVQVVYPVADLVVPVEKDVAKLPLTTLENKLMELIRLQAPESWEENGGQGVMEYFPLGMGLVISQTQANQKRIEVLLAKLRAYKDLEEVADLGRFVGGFHSATTIKKTRFQPAPLVQVVYPVADLVVPVNDFGIGAMHKPGQTLENTLRKLIRHTLCPESWEENGGQATMQYYPLGMSLAISQTPEIQEKINKLLADLRPLQETEVAVEVKLLQISADSFKRLGLEQFQADADAIKVLDDGQVKELLDTAQEFSSTNILQAPKATVFNAQRACINVYNSHGFVTGLEAVEEGGKVRIKPRREFVKVGLESSFRPVVASDRHSITMSLNLNLTDLKPNMPNLAVSLIGQDKDGKDKEITLPLVVQKPEVSTLTLNRCFKVRDGQSVLMVAGSWAGSFDFSQKPLVTHIPYIGRIFGSALFRENQTVLVLVTPRIIINEEEETIFRGQSP